MPRGDFGLLLLLGALGTTGHFIFIRAFRGAPASALTPFTYTQLVWAVLLGWLVFGQFPDGYALAGIAVIAGSGLLLAWHERRRARTASALPAPHRRRLSFRANALESVRWSDQFRSARTSSRTEDL